MRRYAVLSVALSAACAHYSQEDGERLANEVYALTTQVQALQKSLTDTQRISKEQSAQLTDLGKQIQTLNAVAFKNSADFGVQLDLAQQEVARLKGLVEGSKERLDAIDSQLAKVSESELAEERRKSAASDEEKKVAVEDAANRERILQNVDALEVEVLRLVKAGKGADARKYMNEFRQRAAGNPRLKKSLDRVQYLLAESYFSEGNFRLAATEYNNVRKNFGSSAKVPDSLFKMGLCFEKLKLTDDAKVFYKTVIEKHPKSDAAKKAKDRLRELK